MNIEADSTIIKGLVASLLALGITGSGLVQAQLTLEEIIVTATKRNTSLQDTPLAISAITNDTLQRLDIRDFNQFADKIPGLNLKETGPGETKIIIRGVASTIGEATTSVYYDEIPINGGPGTGGDSGRFEPAVNFIDVERIEVLRGPQGTLYGGGSMGGTVRIVYNKPNHEGYEGRVEAGVAGIDDGGLAYNTAGIINVPLIDEVLAARFVGYYRDSGGYIDNTTMGLEDINANTTWGGKFMVKWDPADGVSILGTAILQRSDMPSSNQYHPDAANGLVVTHGVIENMNDNLDLFNLTGNFEVGDWANLVVTGSYYDRNLERDFSANPTWTFSSGPFGFVGCARQNDLPVYPGSCSPAQMAAWITFNQPYSNSVGHQPMDMEMYSYETRLTSDWDAPWNYTVGIFYQTREYFQLSQVHGNGADGKPRNPLLPAIAFRSDTFEETEQLSFFGEASYDLTEQITLTAGIRHFDIDRNNGGDNVIGYKPFGTVLGPVTKGQANDKGFNYKGHIGYQMNDDILLYAQYAEGFRSGGANRLINPLLPESFESDSLVNYEVGAKTTWFDNQLVLNGSYYHIIWSDMQTAADDPTLPVAFTGNAGEATIDGVELEITAFPSMIEGLTINGNINYAYARLTEDQITPIAIANGREGDDVPNVPEWTAGFSVEYGRAVTETLDGFARMDFSWTDSSQSHFNTGGNFAEYEDYQTLALRAGVDKGEEWGADFFIRNVFNVQPHVGGVRSAFAYPGRNTNATIQPRTIGMSVHHNF